ncbi:MAG: hypothetical protein QM492_12370 [Rhodobacterales bacterium]
MSAVVERVVSNASNAYYLFLETYYGALEKIVDLIFEKAENRR